MVFWTRIRVSKIKNSIYQCKKHYSQSHALTPTLVQNVELARIRVLERSSNNSSFKRSSNNSSFNLRLPNYFVRFFAAPVQVNKPKPEVKKGVQMNEQIRSEFVRVVWEDGHTVLSRAEALTRAKKLQLDLVLVDPSAQPPVCKIMDYHREKYQKQLKDKERVKSKGENALRKGDCKEVRFSGKCEQKDLKMKADMVKRLMEKGYRVKCMAVGNENEDLGGSLSRLSSLIEDVAFIESGPRVEKRQAFVLVRHIKFGLPKKSGKKAGQVVEADKAERQHAATDHLGSIQSQDMEDAESGSEEDLTSDEDENFEEDETSWSATDASDNDNEEVQLSSTTRQVESLSSARSDDTNRSYSVRRNDINRSPGASNFSRESQIQGHQPQRNASTPFSREQIPFRNEGPPSRSFGRPTVAPNFSRESQTQGPQLQTNARTPFQRERYPLRNEAPPPRFAQPNRNEPQKQEQSPPQAPTISKQPSYGIFSAPKHAVPSKQNSPLESSRSSSTNNVTPNGNPLKPKGEDGQMPESKNVKQEKYGIFSR